MTARDFVYWLQGYLELGGEIGNHNAAIIAAHIDLVLGDIQGNQAHWYGHQC